MVSIIPYCCFPLFLPQRAAALNLMRNHLTTVTLDKYYIYIYILHRYNINPFWACLIIQSVKNWRFLTIFLGGSSSGCGAPMMYTTPMSPEPPRALFWTTTYRKYILQIMQPSQYWYTRGTHVWQVLEEGRLSTCKLYIYYEYI